MASTCLPCALRLQALAQSTTPSVCRRAFSSATRSQAVLPTFKESSNPEINNVLSLLRDNHFIPAALSERERRLIFRRKYKQSLDENPRTAQIGRETVPLKWVNRRTEIPNRADLVARVTRLIAEGDEQDWKNVPKLLTTLKTLCRKEAADHVLKKLIWKARVHGQFDTIMKCLQNARNTGMTLKKRLLLNEVLAGIRETAQRDDWSQDSVEKALRHLNSMALLLESEEHGTGKIISPDDPRTDPAVLGLFLEVAAVNAKKYQDGQDREDLVKTYAERLMSRLSEQGLTPGEDKRRDAGVQWPVILAIPVWRGLRLAQDILGSRMPQAGDAAQASSSYFTVLDSLAGQLAGVDDVHAQAAEDLWTRYKNAA